MSSGIISVLYVGDSENNLVLRALEKHEGLRWHVYRSCEVYDALATYILYYPHITVFVGKSELTEEVYFHIASLTSPSPRLVDAILIFAESALGRMPETSLLRHYSPPSQEDEVITALSTLALDRANAEAAAAGRVPARATRR